MTITVYGAPWCPDCRRTKQFLGEQRIKYDWIDIGQDPKAAETVREKNNGRQVIPTIVFDDGSFLAEPTNDELARKLGLSLKAERSFYELIIIGGGPAGLTASIYAAREGIDCLVIEKSALGGQAGVTERIDNYPGFPEGIGGAELADRIAQQARRYGVTLLSAVGVRSVDRDGDYLSMTTESGHEYGAKAVVVATGSTYRRLGVPGEDDLIGAGIHFCATCDGPFYKGSKELMVIGGGNSGVEEGLFLTQFTEKVILLEFNPELKASALLQEKARSDPKFEIYTNTQVMEFRGGAGKLKAVLAKDRVTGETLEFHPEGAFVFIGLPPNTAFLQSKVDLDQWGFVVTDGTLLTSMAGVFAAGDLRVGSTKQLASAIGEGGVDPGAAVPPEARRAAGEGSGRLSRLCHSERGETSRCCGGRALLCRRGGLPLCHPEGSGVEGRRGGARGIWHRFCSISDICASSPFALTCRTLILRPTRSMVPCAGAKHPRFTTGRHHPTKSRKRSPFCKTNYLCRQNAAAIPRGRIEV